MNAPERVVDWLDANQDFLVAEFRRLAALLGEAGAAPPDTEALRAAMPVPAAIDRLAALFGLSPFERDLLLLVAGVELDARLAALCAEAAHQPQRPWATFGLALAALPQPHWSAIAPHEPLRRWRLLELDEGAGIATARLRLDERVLHCIAGINQLDHRLAPLLAPLPAPGAMGRDQQAAVATLLAQLHAAVGRLPAVLLAGDDAPGLQDVAGAVAAALDTGVLRLRAADVPAAPTEQAAFAALWSREAALLDCALLVQCGDEDQGDDERASRQAVARLLERLDGLVFVCGPESALPAPGVLPQLRQAIARPDAPERLQLWQAALGPRAEALAPALDQLAGQYRLGARRIQQIAAEAPGPDAAALHAASRGAGHGMPGLAQRIDTRAGWSELVLPPAQQAQLRQIAAQARHRLTVLHRWGFAGQGQRGLGLATLFWGDSGTGKTLAAEVLAAELDLALYRIDLSAVVSKYIGETEKNLRRVFDSAEEVGAILLFDEADALFGKRSEVKDSHDRYANIEVSYLLQRMESYGGLAILTSNHKAALDPAFQRRLRFVVHFPFPDQAQREGIWRAVFPPAAPLDAGVDFTRLARLGVAGGSIRNIALGAAFLAAEAGTPIDMAALRRAALLEAAKREKAFSDAELRGLE
ncbi:ATP-binding protein [Pseudorhodoferax sp.]|uniref:ATP-binding protein n=1 Tax=Pseudorhodoferax sp. TaxID=1993553 RepID=UPI002DD69800|nr:ATP-binding protein [Pseudorhodoferax sp.]